MSKIWLGVIGRLLAENNIIVISKDVQRVCSHHRKCASRQFAGFRNLHQDLVWHSSPAFLRCSASAVSSCTTQAFNQSRWVTTDQSSGLDDLTYERIANETLEDLTEFFESLDELENCPEDYDVQYSNGVLTVSFGSEHGTYVINKQTPNKQIWLSSPKSGPKRYDFSSSRWIYQHEDRDLHTLLTEEISQIFQEPVDFSQLGQDSWS